MSQLNNLVLKVLEGKLQYVEFAGNLVPVTKSGEQLKLVFRAFKENRLPFTVRVKDPHADALGRALFMKEPKVIVQIASSKSNIQLNIYLILILCILGSKGGCTSTSHLYTELSFT